MVVTFFFIQSFNEGESRVIDEVHFANIVRQSYYVTVFFLFLHLNLTTLVNIYLN